MAFTPIGRRAALNEPPGIIRASCGLGSVFSSVMTVKRTAPATTRPRPHGCTLAAASGRRAKPLGWDYNHRMSTQAPTSPADKPSTAVPPSAGHGVTLHAAFAGVRRVPQPVNEPNHTYAPGTPQRAELKARLTSMAAEKIEIPIVIGGKEIRTGRTEKAV